jgi:hypothetical protein
MLGLRLLSARPAAEGGAAGEPDLPAEKEDFLGY